MKVLASLPYFREYCKDAVKLLEENGCQVVSNELGRPLTFNDLKDIVIDIDGVIAGVDEWDSNLFNLAPNLKAIARFGVGVDNLNLEDAKAHQITISNCPGINTSSVAEHAVMLILSVVRQLPAVNTAVKQGKWVRAMHHELKGMTVGLIGFGAIARNLARKLKPFEVTLIAYDKYPNQNAAESLGVTLMSLDDIIRNSDIISLHIPATPETKHLINKKTLALAKDGVFIVNTSRGAVVDEAAVCDALESGKLAGFGTDVYENEPLTADSPLSKIEQAVCTPHVAAESYENWATTGIITAQALLDVFARKEPKNKLV